ncbi:MAG: LCP family protein [Cyanobacteriota bacterium]|jgi:LCP family protein required for cell wall assembly
MRGITGGAQPEWGKSSQNWPMADRRDRRPALPNPIQRAARGRLPRNRWSWRGLGVAALALLGAFSGASLLAVVWPKPDRSAHLREEITAATLAPKPAQAITVLVIGSDADKLQGSSNGAAPPGPANGDTVLLVRVTPKGPVQVLQLPTELALSLPGRKAPVALGQLYREGGVALTAETLRELLGLGNSAPERYIVVPRQALRELVDALGGLEVSPPRRMNYRDLAMKYTIDLQSGLQRLTGGKVEQMVRFRDKWLGEAGRRANQQLVINGLQQQMGQPAQLAILPPLIQTWSSQVETNLSQQEILSLLAAGLDNPKPLQFSSLPMKPATKDFGELRQLDPAAGKPLWPQL